MIKVYIHKYQLDNFFHLHEPVELIIFPVNDNYVECILDASKLIFKNITDSRISIELKHRKKLFGGKHERR